VAGLAPAEQCATVHWVCKANTQGSPLDIQFQRTDTWSAIAWPPYHMSSSSSILPPPSSHCAFISARQNPALFSNMLLCQFPTCLKLPNLKLRKSGNVRHKTVTRTRQDKLLGNIWVEREEICYEYLMWTAKSYVCSVGLRSGWDRTQTNECLSILSPEDGNISSFRNALS
jgi:hypothetical protein